MSKLDLLRSKMTIRTPPESRRQLQQQAATVPANVTVTLPSTEEHSAPADHVVTQQQQQQQQQQVLSTETPAVPQPSYAPPPSCVAPSSGLPVHSFGNPGATALATAQVQAQRCYEPGCEYTFTDAQLYHRHLNQVHPLPQERPFHPQDEGRLSVVSNVSHSSEFGDIHPYPVDSVLRYPALDFHEGLDQSTFYSRTRSVAGLARSFKVQAKKFSTAFAANGSDDTKKRVFKELKVRFDALVKERMHAEELLSPEQLEDPRYYNFLVSYETMYDMCEQQYLEEFPESDAPSSDILESTHVDANKQNVSRPSTTISEIPPTVDATNLNSPNQFPVSTHAQNTVPARSGVAPRTRTVGFRFPAQYAGTGVQAPRPIMGARGHAGTSVLGGVRFANSAPRMNTGLPPANSHFNQHVGTANRFGVPSNTGAFSAYRAPPPPRPYHAPPPSHYQPPAPANSLIEAVFALAQSNADQNFDITRRIIKFDGTVSSYVKWEPIWNENWKHMKTKLNYDEYRIFAQFLNSMEDKIANQYKHLDPSESSVQVILDSLYSEFGTPDKLHHELHRNLKSFAAEPLVMKDFEKAKVKLSTLLTLHKNFVDHELIDPENGQSFIITVESAMPQAFRREWSKYVERNHGRLCSSTEYLEQLQAFFRIEARTRASDGPKPAKPEQPNHPNQPRNQQRNQQGSLPRSFATRQSDNSKEDKTNCIICNKASHGAKRSLKCPELKNKTPQEVCALIKKHKACYLCLLPNHSSKECESGLKPCTKPGSNPDGKCGKMHCRAAHIDSDQTTKARNHLTNEDGAEQENEAEESPANETENAET